MSFIQSLRTSQSCCLGWSHLIQYTEMSCHLIKVTFYREVTVVQYIFWHFWLLRSLSHCSKSVQSKVDSILVSIHNTLIYLQVALVICYLTLSQPSYYRKVTQSFCWWIIRTGLPLSIYKETIYRCMFGADSPRSFTEPSWERSACLRFESR